MVVKIRFNNFLLKNDIFIMFFSVIGFRFFLLQYDFMFQCYVSPKPHLSQVSGRKVKCDHPTLGRLNCGGFFGGSCIEKIYVR